MSSVLLADPGPSQARPRRVHQLTSEAIHTAGNGSSSNGSSDTHARPRKRPRQPDTWKREVAKAKRVRGETYILLSTGKQVTTRSTRPSCRCQKEVLRFVFVQVEGRNNSQFNKMGNNQLQNVHLFGFPKSKEVARR